MPRKKPAAADATLFSAEPQPIEERDFISEMETAYLEYSMSVIVSRALPDVRDGLKPVQRRILWGMQTSGVRATGPRRKCAKVVGEVMGSYHPHGDQAIYDALVRMAQQFSYYVPLVDGQGNFGSPGYPPAAMRYTECRMTPTAERLLADIGEGTVDFVPNYDGETEEPSVLPAAFPNLLVNGASGIAVGMATSIPTHNPLEVIDAALIVLDTPGATVKRLMKKLRGPDFTSGCDILDPGGDTGILAAYTSGSGKVTCRASVDVTGEARGATRLSFRNLPPAVSVSQVAEQIVDAIKRGRLQAISNVVDASDKEGQELQVILKKGHSAPATVAELYKVTKLEDTASMSMRALVDGVPRVLSVLDILRAFCDHRMEVVLRRSVYRIERARARRHIVVALLKALDRIDEVIAAIRAAQDVPGAKVALCELLEIDDEQATAIVDMQLRRLTGLETQTLRDELDELDAHIALLDAIIADEDVRRTVVRDELAAVRDGCKDMKRRSRIVSADDVEAEEEEVAEAYADVEVRVQVLRGGWLEVSPADSRRQPWRGGDPNHAPLSVLTTSQASRVAVVTDDGRSWAIALLDVPQGRRVRISDLTEAPRDAVPLLAWVPPAGDEAPVLERTLLLATSDGKGKRLATADTVASRRDGLLLTKLDDGVRLVGAAWVTDAEPAVLVASDGHATRLGAGEIPVQGRGAGGVRVIRLAPGVTLVAAAAALDDQTIVVGTGGGWVKAIVARDIPLHGRGARGVAAVKTTPARGEVVGAVVAERESTLYLVDADNKSHDIQVAATSRAAQGKQLTASIATVFVIQ